jgi:SRSO17 transposase
MANNSVGVTYHRLHHFLTEAPWLAMELNQRRLEVMNQCKQTQNIIIINREELRELNYQSMQGRK